MYPKTKRQVEHPRKQRKVENLSRRVTKLQHWILAIVEHANICHDRVLLACHTPFFVAFSGCAMQGKPSRRCCFATLELVKTYKVWAVPLHKINGLLARHTTDQCEYPMPSPSLAVPHKYIELCLSNPSLLPDKRVLRKCNIRRIVPKPDDSHGVLTPTSDPLPFSFPSQSLEQSLLFIITSAAR